MKSVICSQQAPCLDYPKLMESVTNIGLVVLMTSSGIGTVVSQGSSNHKLGYVGTSWAINLFKDFNGKVTLSND